MSFNAEDLRSELGTPITTPFMGDNDKYNFVYLISSPQSELLYIGKRSTITLEDGYKGSGFRVMKHLNENDRKQWIRTEIAFFNTPEEAIAAESKLLKSKIVQDNKHLLFNILDPSNNYQERLDISKAMGMLEAYKHVTTCTVKFGSSSFETDYFIDDEGNEWLRAKPAHSILGGDKEGMKVDKFLRQVNLIPMLNLISGYEWQPEHNKQATPIEMQAKFKFTPAAKTGSFLIKPLFLKYCTTLSPAFELCVLSGDYSII